MSNATNRDPASISDHIAESTPTYETKLAQDLGWAMDQGSRHFEEKSAVHEALRKIGKRLNEMQIPYAVIGGMALFKHGYRRFTEDVDILVSRESLAKIHKKLQGLGYRPPFAGSKHLRDVEHQVRIEFFVTGDYPGDGTPTSFAFPDPSGLTDLDNEVHYLKLNNLVELKLASGLTGKDQMKDLVDVQELVGILSLPKSFRETLSSYVRPKFDELWDAAHSHETRYMMLWRNKFLTVDASNFDEVIAKLQDAVDLLKRMQADGVEVDPKGGIADDYIHLVTTDPEVAKKYDMHDERDFLG